MRVFTTLAMLFILAICMQTASAAESPRAEADNARVFRDLEYAIVDGQRLSLDLYLPLASKEPAPLIIWIHGGGWAAGNKQRCPARRLTQQRYAVASIDYRLSGEAIWPAQIVDCKSAVRWLRANAARYSLDPNRFAAWGSSAGGHLAAMLGTAGDVKQFDQGDHLDVSSRVQAVCDYFGPTDLLQMDAHAAPGARLRHDDAFSPEAKLIGGPIQQNKEKARGANPITYISKEDAPFLVVHGDEDPVVPWHQSQLIFEALRDAGVPVQFHTVRGAGHGIGIGGREIDDLVDAFFTRNLKQADGGKRPVSITSHSQAVMRGPMPQRIGRQ